MHNISGFGLRVAIRASVTFPSGIILSAFADDSDPLDLPQLTLAETAMGLNGELLTWAKPNGIPMNLSLTPNGDDDINMTILAEANRVGRGKRGARDVITATIKYPDGSTVTMSQGVIVGAIIGIPVASAGRMKSKPFQFMFENMTRG